MYLESWCSDESSVVDENIDEDDDIEVDVYNKFMDNVENDFGDKGKNLKRM